MNSASEQHEDIDDDITKEELAQQMHEIMASIYPELCEPDFDSESKKFANSNMSADDRRHLIQLHDFTVHHGAYCEGMDHDDDADAG